MSTTDGDARAPSAPAASPVPAAVFIDNAQCIACHHAQAASWQQSHHAKAMAPPTEATVQGNFANAEFRHQGITTRFTKRDGKFIVRTDGPDGKLADFEVAYTFGVAPLQQYLIAQPGGRLQPLQVAWDDQRKRWFHLLPEEKAPAGDVLHWTGRYQTANTMCISCHTTGFEKRYDAVADAFDSRWKEVNVSCQACHGAGERHAQWARLRTEGKPPADLPGERYGLSVSLASAGAKQQVEMCSTCHSRRSELTGVARPGEPRLDHYLPGRLTSGLYHADGQQLDEVFVDGSYRQSRMYQMGVGCTSCHDPHSGKLRFAGNAVCTQCHAPQANATFSSAAGAFDTPTHHFHKEGSAGAQCTSCHMPAKTYMQIQPRPDHSLRVPRPDLSVKIGTPNACNGCHTDRSAQWAADEVAKRFGAKRRETLHYGESFAMARAGHPGASEALVALVTDPKQPPIVRATALAELRADAVTGLGARLEATRDADPEVRAAAADSFEQVEAKQRLYALGPLLRDPVRAVRIAAAHALSSLPAQQVSASLRPDFDAALAEYIAAQEVSLDMPGARLNLAVVHQNIGQMGPAEEHYLAALRLDPDFTPARVNLARLYNGTGRNADAERILKDGLKREPGIGELQYMLGLLLAEEQRLPEAAEALGRAAKLMPDRARVHYNLGLTLQQLGRRDAAAAALASAHRRDPRDVSVAQALALLYARSGQRAEALEWSRKWVSLAPGDPQARQLVRELGAGP